MRRQSSSQLREKEQAREYYREKRSGGDISQVDRLPAEWVSAFVNEPDEDAAEALLRRYRDMRPDLHESGADVLREWRSVKQSSGRGIQWWQVWKWWK